MMMSSLVFICFSEDSGDVQCLLLEGDLAQAFLRDPDAFMVTQFSEPKLICSWEVPRDFSSASAGGSFGHVFKAILGLDALTETSVVSDLLAAVFNAGYQLAHKNRHKPIPRRR